MGQNVDGTATCTRCGRLLPGYGVMYGLVASRVSTETGEVENFIFCYVAGCAETILNGNLNH